MADLRYIQPNRLREEVNRYRYRLLWLGVALVFFAPFVSLVFVGTGLAVLLWLAGKKDIRLIGAEGEDRALGIPKALPGSLATLSESYVVFNQVRVPLGNSYRELDFVVLGSNGIFVIEVKHHRGEIKGNEANPHWRQRKLSRQGKRYEQALNNPVTQVKGGVYALRQHLAAKGIKNWIEGIVVFSHPECSLKVENTAVPVLPLSGLANYIRTYRPKWAPRSPDEVMRTLIELTRNDLPSNAVRSAKTPFLKHLKPSGPQHISCFMRDFVPPQKKIKDIMRHDYKKAARAARSGAVPPAPPTQPVAYPDLAGRPRPPLRLRVIPGGRAQEAARIVRTREVTVTVRETTLEEQP